MMFDDHTWAFAVKRWHVAFVPGPVLRWWDVLCSPSMRHVLAFGWCDHAQVWVIVDATHAGLRIRLVPDGIPFYGVLAQMKVAGASFLEMDVQESTSTGLRFGLWCVPVVKSLLGVGGWALRPEALYREMVRKGADVSFARTDHES
jgi:hypothetical protein